MIECRPVSLTKKEEDEFRSWLGHNACTTLIKIVRSRMKASAAKALQSACGAAHAPLKLDAANVDLAEAQRCESFLVILEEIRNQEQPFILTQLT